jgi:hypothetical protein
MNWLADLASGKRTVYGILIAIILLTLPCYCLGFGQGCAGRRAC